MLLGQIAIGGKDAIKESIETKKPLAYISENLILYPNLSGVENLDYFSGLADKYSPAERIFIGSSVKIRCTSPTGEWLFKRDASLFRAEAQRG